MDFPIALTLNDLMEHEYYSTIWDLICLGKLELKLEMFEHYPKLINVLCCGLNRLFVIKIEPNEITYHGYKLDKKNRDFYKSLIRDAFKKYGTFDYFRKTQLLYVYDSEKYFPDISIKYEDIEKNMNDFMYMEELFQYLKAKPECYGPNTVDEDGETILFKIKSANRIYEFIKIYKKTFNHYLTNYSGKYWIENKNIKYFNHSSKDDEFDPLIVNFNPEIRGRDKNDKIHPSYAEKRHDSFVVAARGELGTLAKNIHEKMSI